ncbi:unnamed protein product [Schistosoma mattheei]|uniref:Uncharacterized protein n=1 Tax=Schistosoma mattheei TaxID=31246 RepID=A0AA85BKZ7_9TREM|nr:unnamed protein product [Schistosoma mattheei]
MNCNSRVLKDHFTLPPEDSNARYISELTHNEQLLKETKLKQFLITEQKRSKLYRSLIAKVNSSCIDDKLLSNLPSESVLTTLNQNTSCDSASRTDSQKCSNRSEVLTNSEKFFTQSPRQETSLSSRTIITTTTNNTTHNHCKCTEQSIDDLSSRAKALSLHSFPYLVKSLKLRTSSLNEHKARQMRQAVGRRIYSDAERKKVCDLRRNKEDLILSENIKAKAEKRFLNVKSNKTLKSSNYFERNSTQILSTNRDNLTVNDHSNSIDENKLNNNSNQTIKCNYKHTNLSDTMDTKEISLEKPERDGHNGEMLSLWSRLSNRLNNKIPPLCLCMEYSRHHIDEVPPWLKCANNCKFYHNPEAFLKVLLDYMQSLNLS